jgi:hypothetical protein
VFSIEPYRINDALRDLD